MIVQVLDSAKDGSPCLWENGGGYTNTGEACIIAKVEYQGSRGVAVPKVPIYIRKRGILACNNHALIPIDISDIIIKAHHKRLDFVIDVYSVKSIEAVSGNTIANMELINKFEMGQWSNDHIIDISNAVRAAKDKCECYHCREPHFVESPIEDVI